MAPKTATASPSGEQSGSATPSASEHADASTQAQDAAMTDSTSVTGERPSASEPAADLTRASSQPMTKSSSTGSEPLASAKANAADTASPYGTRSRNRNGTSRPNYAEDRDIDTEMDDYRADKKDGDPKKSSRAASQSATATATAAHPDGSGSRSSGSSRKAAAGDDSKLGTPQPGSKDAAVANATIGPHASNTSSSVQPSKKRKAATQSSASASASASQSQTPAPSYSTSTGPSRRSAAAAQAVGAFSESNMLTFDNCGARSKDGALVADDGTALRPNDNVYLVCEPPGEPYYLGRIMEFLHVQNDASKPVDAIRVNWFYRPKDIGKKASDTRVVFATMHSDISPLTSLRGKCQIKHKAEIDKMDEYRKTPDSFWYEKLYDRYIQKNYDLIPTSQIVNVPEKVKKVLDYRWRFIIVEQGRGKELTSAVKSCKRCTGYCASNDSVDCAVCKNTYHMNCVRPPLLKKPSRGFAWSCAACSRAQERKLEARHTPNLADPYGDGEDDDMLEDEDDDLQPVDTSRNTPVDDESHHGTAEQIYHASLWPWRYLGMHCKPEDALDYDDRIYPRASTRVGPRHQAVVLPWPGRPVEYLKPIEFKKNGKKDAKFKEAQAAFEAEKARREKLPKWVQDEPAGYVARGEDLDETDPNATSTLLWKPPPTSDVRGEDPDEQVDHYMERAIQMAPKIGLPEISTNFRDVALETYFRNDYSEERALDLLPKTEWAAFNEPELSPAEIKTFEEAVAKYGSELQLVTRHVKSVPYGSIVRFYYVWKKTKQGKQIWGNFQNRKSKKEAKKAQAAANKLQDDIADDADDSAFDAAKAVEKKKGFICKFCNTKTSRQWRRAPNASNTPVTENGGKNTQKDKGQYIQALCRRCAELWRRYAIQWEDIDEISKKVSQGGARAWKRKQDEELLRVLYSVQDTIALYDTPEPANSPNATVTAPNGGTSGEPPRKKLKGLPDRDRDSDPAASDSGAPPPKKKEKTVEKPAPPPVPEIPKPRTMPCAICDQLEPLGDQHLSCKECRMTVHRNCYGVVDNRSVGKWTCDMCINDKNPQVSIRYACVLCPVDHTEHDFVEPPKPSTHKKKTEKDKERERLEREQAQKAAEYYRKKQEDMNRPVNPREPLKRTADNNWVHVTCAVWTPEVKFENPKALAPVEGIPSIPRARYDEVCHACGHTGGACVSCHHCRTPIHVACARQRGYVLGFDITPVKGSRRDQHNVVTINGESGAMTAQTWCKEHVPTKTIVHRMHDIVNDQGQNALQLYVQTCKQADLEMTGTVRKANLIATAVKASTGPVTSTQRRASTTAPPHGHSESSPVQNPGEKLCITCGSDVSPRWWPVDDSDQRELTNGHHGSLGTEAQKFIEQRRFQCHKCRKAHRKPHPHTQPKREMSPARDSIRDIPAALPLVSAQLAAPRVRSPPLPGPESSRTGITYPWMAPAPAPSAAVPQHTSPTAPPVGLNGPPPIHAPPAPPHQPPSGPTIPFGASAPRYAELEGRPQPQQSPPSRQINGGPPPLQPATSLGNLSSLRPPPMAIPPASQVAPSGPNGHHGQALHNGLPPSPRRMDSQQPLPHPPPYVHSYHNAANSLPNGGGPPPPRVPDTFSQGLISQRAPFSTPHGSPPSMSRDGLLDRDAREPQGGPLSGPSSMRPSEPPRPAGASTSPSVRNLLS